MVRVGGGDEVEVEVEVAARGSRSSPRCFGRPFLITRAVKVA